MDPTFLQYLFAIKQYMREEYPDITQQMDTGSVCTSREQADALNSLCSEIVWDGFMNMASIPMCAGGISLAIKEYAARN